MMTIRTKKINVIRNLISVVCALTLVTSLIPSQVSLAWGSDNSSESTASAESVERLYMSEDGCWAAWVTSSQDMPSGVDFEKQDMGAALTVEPLSDSALAAAKSEVAAAYEGGDDLVADSSRFLSGTLKVGGQDLPADAQVSLVYSAYSNSERSFAAWSVSADGSLSQAPCEMGAHLASLGYQWSMPKAQLSAPGSFVLADVAGLKEKTSEPVERLYMSEDGCWAAWVTSSQDMPSGVDFEKQDMGAALTVEPLSDSALAAAKSEVAAAYEGGDDLVADSSRFLSGTLKVGGQDLPADAQVSLVYSAYSNSERSFAAWSVSADGSLSQAPCEMGAHLASLGYQWSMPKAQLSAPGSFVLADVAGLKEKTTLEAGTYTVTANLYIPGSENIVLPGVQVYMLCPTFAPTIPVSDNAKMVVDENGNKTISFELTNSPSDIFTLQNIAGAAGETEVSNAVRINDDTYYGTDGSTETKCYGRIGSFDVKLLNDSGDYSFSSCKEFPVPVSRYTTMQVRLSVDLSSARRSYVAPEDASSATTREFVDSATGFTAKVTTTESDVASALNAASTKLVVDNSASGEGFKSAQGVLSPLYNGDLSFDYYSASLVDASGNQVKLSGNTEVGIKVPTSKSGICDVVLLQNDTSTTLLENTQPSDGGFSVTREKLGTFAIVDKTKASKWTSKTLVNSDTGYSWTESYTDASSKNGDSATPGSILSSIIRFDVAKVTDADAVKSWQSQIDASFANGEGKTTVTNAFGCFPRNFNLNQVIDTWSASESKRTLSIPRADNDGIASDTKAFLVTVENGKTSAQLLETSVTDSSVDVAVFPSTLTEDESYARLACLFNGEGGETNSAYEDYGKSYIVLASGVDARQYERTFTGEGSAADASYKIATYKSDLAAALKQAKANFSAYDSTSEAASSIKEAFSAQLDIDPVFRVFNVDVLGADGSSVSVGSDEETSLTLKSDYASSRVYQWDGSKLTLVTQGTDETFTLKGASFGAYVLVDAATAKPKQYSFTFTDEETGIKASATTTYKPWAEKLGAEGVSLKVTKTATDSESYKQVAELFKNVYVQEAPFEIYTIDLIDADGASLDLGYGFYLSVAFPVDYSSADLYSVTDNDGTFAISSKGASLKDGELQAVNVQNGSSFALADSSNIQHRTTYTKSFDTEYGFKVTVTSSEPCMEKYLKDDGFAAIEVSEIKSSKSFESAMESSAYKTPDYIGYSICLRGSDGTLAEPKYVGTNRSSYTRIVVTDMSAPTSWSYSSTDYGTDGVYSPFDLVQVGSDDSVTWSGVMNGSARPFYRDYAKESDGSYTFKKLYIPEVYLGSFDDCYLISDRWSWLQWKDAELPVSKELVYTGKSQSGYTITSSFYGTETQPMVEVVSGDISATEVGEYTCTVRPSLPFVRWAGCEGDDARAERTFTWKIVEAGDVSALEQPIAEAQKLLDSIAVSENGKDILSNAKWVSQADHDALAAAIASAQALADSNKAVAKTAVDDQVAALAAAVSAFNAAQKDGLKDAGATYSVTANLSMPGEYNPVLSGVTVYVNNPNNPFTDKAGNSPVLDGGSAEGVQSTAPTTPMADNAIITVAPDGTKTLTLNLPNPVFTLQDLGTCEALPDVKVETKEPADKSVWDYGKYDTRICRITVTLPADADATGVQTYTFTGSKLYAVPINADIQPEAGKPALNLTIDYSTVKTSKAVDTSALTSAVADAQKLAAGVAVSADGSDVSTEGTWVTKGVLQSFNDAIAKASAVADSNLLSQQMVTDATEALQAAVDTFKAAMKPGTKDERVKVEKPSAVGGLVYTGSEQAGVASAEGYTLSGASATDAGAYTAKATLKAGFVWADGSADAVEIPWSIARATLTATYAGETVSAGTAPKLRVDVAGFVGGEAAASAAGYVAPTVSVPAALEAGKSYDLVPAGGQADNYDFVYVGGKLVVKDASESALNPGTYTITANLRMPGQYNPVLPDTTVYANNPNNPFGIDEGTSAFPVDANKAPTDPMSMNATLVVAKNGTKTLVLPIDNPVFTTQSLGRCEQLPNVWVMRSKAPFATEYSVNKAGSYGKYDTRISKLGAVLTDAQDSGSVSYTFKGSTLYALPIDTDISPDGDVALELTVDYDSLKQTSDSTEVTFANTGDNGSALGELAKTDSDNGGNGGNGGNSGGNQGGNSGDNGGSNGSNGSNGGGSNGGSTTVTTTASGHFAAGTYTVSANLWFDKSVTGLPLNPHLTNSSFPPSTPVSNNATLTVDESGHAWVSIPVVIQDKVMTINNVWGSGVSYNGSTVTIDLGTPSSSQTQFTGTCSSSVTIGWLARTIAAGIFNGVWDHTWTTNWEIDFGSTLPASGGGSLPAAAQAILDGLNGVSDQQSAAEAALSALDESGSAGTSAKSASSQAKKAASQGEAADEPASEGGMNAAVVAGVVCGVVALAALGAWLLFGRKKRNGVTDEEK